MDDVGYTHNNNMMCIISFENSSVISWSLGGFLFFSARTDARTSTFTFVSPHHFSSSLFVARHVLHRKLFSCGAHFD